MSRPAALLDALATVPFSVAVLVFALGVVRVPLSGRAGPAEFAAALSLGLEFLLAAGLLRLAAAPTAGGLAVVAAIVVLRRVIGVGIRLGLRALGGARPGLVRA